MKRSLFRLSAMSLAAFLLFGILVMATYVITWDWRVQDARAMGVFWIYETIERTPVAERPAMVQTLDSHFVFQAKLATTQEISRRASHPLAPGEWHIEREWFVGFWMYLAFTDGSGGLIIGPFVPTNPPGHYPIGLLFALLGTPVLTTFIAYRIARELLKIERASRALASGELGARVDNEKGPSSELAASFNLMADRVEDRIRQRDELIQAVSHEFGSPLARLRFHMELMEDPGEEHSAPMTRDIDALEALVAELLTYIQSDHVEVSFQTMEVEAQLRDIAELAKLEAPGELEVHVDVPEGARVRGDVRQFQRAVENLLRNAVRYAGEVVQVRVVVTETHTEVHIEDDGPGIPEQMRERVLEPFARLEKDRARETGGAGLGLAIVQRIMERHGGEVWIGVSKLGGAQVTTRWPHES